MVVGPPKSAVEAGFKPLQVAVVKSYGHERWSQSANESSAGTI